MMNNLTPMIGHLEELRKRILVCFLIICVLSVFSFYHIEQILYFITKPAGKLFFLKPTEAFFINLKVAFYSGIFFSMPIIIYNIWQFVKPALLELEKKFVALLMPVSYFLFISGIAFSFFIVLPPCIKILLSSGSEFIQPMISVSSYVSFTICFLLGFGFIFQLPIVILVLSKLKIITPSYLTQNRKYAVLIIFILAGILTPGPDVFSQFMMAIPTLLIYEFSIVLCKFF